MERNEIEQETMHIETGWAEIVGAHERCRVLAKAMLCSEFDKDDRDAIAWLMQDCIDELGKAIEKARRK